MNPWNLFAGGAALGLVAGLWDKIKAVAWRARKSVRAADRDPVAGRP